MTDVLDNLPQLDFDGIFYVAIAVGVICLLSSFFYLIALVRHMCLMNVCLVVFACLWAVINILLIVGLVAKINVLVEIWVWVAGFYGFIMMILLIVYASHCCCCCVQPDGCGLAILILGIIFHFLVYTVFMVIVNSARNTHPGLHHK